MNNNQGHLNKNLRISFRDGIFASGMTGFTQDYFTPFLLLLGATTKHIGFLNALPNLFASLIQFKSADFVEKVKSRKKIIGIFVFLQATILLPMAAVAFWKGTKPFLFIGLVTLFTALGSFATPAWGSVMSDLVAEEKRGEYFGWRNRMLGFTTIAATFLAGSILQIMRRVNIFYGFALIFVSAFLFRIISWHFLTRIIEPPFDYKKENSFTIFDFLGRIKESNFAKFVLFVSTMNFSVNLASPFFSVLMLRDLNFSYLLYTVITVTATLTTYLLISRWGKIADRVGNLKIIKFVSPLIGGIPLLWILNRHPLFLIFAQIFSGFLWAGFNICASNFIYDAVTPGKRTRCIAYFNVFNGLALCCGAILGGFLVPKLPALRGYNILSLFFISFVLRTVIGTFLPMMLREVRPVEQINHWKLFFSVVGMKPLLGIERKTIQY